MMYHHMKRAAIGCLIMAWASAATAGNLNLDQAVENALRNNPSVREAENRGLSADENLKSRRADFLPKASANYSLMYLDDAPYQVVGGVPRQVGDTESAHWDLIVVQPLFKGFGLVSRYQSARSESDIRALERKKAAQDVVRDVKTAYYEALLARSMEKVAEDQVKTLDAQERDAQGFYDHGVIPRNDLLKSKIAKASTVQDLEKAKADARLALSRLNLVMGGNFDADYELTPVDATVSDAGELAVLMAHAVKNRPELQVMEKTMEIYDAGITGARSACYPEINLVGRYERNGNDAAADENDYSNDHNASVSVQARWTFFEWGKTRADIQAIRYEKRAFSEKVKAAEDQVRLETQQEYLNVKVREKNIKTAEEALEQAKENFRITRSRYLQNVTTATEVLEAQTFLARAETDYHKSVYGYLIARARLDRAVGR